MEVGLVGVLETLAGAKSVTLEFSEPLAVREVVRRLVDSSPRAFRQALVDPGHNSPRADVVILVNKREVSVLEGLDTKVGNGDKLMLIPVSHGG